MLQYRIVKKHHTAWLIAVLVASFLAACARKETLKETRMLMGTVVSIELAGVPAARTPRIRDAVWAEAERLEKLFSSHLPGSEVNRINKEGFERPVKVSADTMAVLSRAIEVSRLTDSAFDVTVGPLMSAWKFFPDKKGGMPPEEEIKQALQSVGWRYIRLDPAQGTVRLLKPGMRIDLAGIAKGYVVDRMVEAAKRMGVRNALINAGGDIYCLGTWPGGGKWRIGLEHPREEGGVLRALALSDIAVATSGDYRNYFIHGKKRYSHIVDPRTGQPARTGVVESCVIAPDCTTADALATALFVMGVEKGLRLVNCMQGVECIIVTEEGDGIETHFSNEAEGFCLPQ